MPSGGTKTIRDEELEKELEKELERDLETSKNAREILKSQQKKEKEASLKKEQELNRKKEEKDQKIIPFPEPITIPNFRGNASLQEFNWKTGKQGELDALAAGLVNYIPQTHSGPLIESLTQ